MTQTTAPVIADAEQIRWQRDAAAVLGQLLELAAKRGLPAISWTVAEAGARLVGQCYRHPTEARRGDFAAWREALGEPDTERENTTSGGIVHLVATWERGGSAGKGLRPLLSDRDGYQRAAVVLAADIYADDLPDAALPAAADYIRDVADELEQGRRAD